MTELIELQDGQKEICRTILESLSDWFIPMVIERVVEEAEHVQMIGARVNGEIVGIMTLKQQTPDTIEIRALGVSPSCHRQGVGRQLIARAEAIAQQKGARMLSLKTVGPSDSNPKFVPTRAFYAAQGFVHVEELPLWGPETSCLLMAKPLAEV